jgi:hypothetical protein
VAVVWWRRTWQWVLNRGDRVPAWLWFVSAALLAIASADDLITASTWSGRLRGLALIVAVVSCIECAVARRRGESIAKVFRVRAR